MKQQILSFLLPFFIFATFSGIANEHSFLEGRIQPDDKRYQSFLIALKGLKQIGAKVIVETGTARQGDRCFWGDGGSTVIFGDFAMQNGMEFYSVDISPEAIENARNATLKFAKHTHLILEDSIEFLKNFSQPIDFLYLDSFDYEYGNPLPSQEHHLKEVKAAYPRLHRKSMIMIDDCHLPEGGKGKLAIEYLVSLGWEVLYDGYQTVLVQKSFFD